MSQPRVVVVVLNWNGWRDTVSCLASLKQDPLEGAQILVVDNGSHDGSEERIRAEHPDVPILQTGSNLGFAGGNNAGMDWALERGASFVLLLNNDTEVEPGFVDSMVQKAEASPEVGIVGASIAYADRPDRLWAFGGGRFDIASGRVRHIQNVVPESQLETRGNVHFYVTGCAMLLRRELIESVGKLDTSYFHFCEDADLCLRAQRAGYRLAVAGDARLIHKVSATTQVSSPVFLYYNLRSRLRLVQRFGPEGSPRPGAVAVLWMRLWRPALQSGQGASGWAALRRAWKDFRAGVEGPAPPELSAGRGRRAATALLAALLLTLAAPGQAEVIPDEGQRVSQLWATIPGEAPGSLGELLQRMAADPAHGMRVLSPLNASSRDLTRGLLEIAGWPEPRALEEIPGLHLLKDDSPPPGERPPTWSEVRWQALRLLERVALDDADARDQRLKREVAGSIRRAVRPMPSEVGRAYALWQEWWTERGSQARYYVDPARIPDVTSWLTALRAPARSREGLTVVDLLGSLRDDGLRRAILLDQLDPELDGHLVAEAMELLPLYKEAFVEMGFASRRWDRELGKVTGYHPSELRGVALDILARAAPHVPSGIDEDELIRDWLGWWQRARFQAIYYRDATEAPSLDAWIGGLDRDPAHGGRSMASILRELYLAASLRELLLEELGPQNSYLVAELIAWLQKDRVDAASSGFEMAYRAKPLRPLPGDPGPLLAIPWRAVQRMIRTLLREITGDAGLPEEGMEDSMHQEFWRDWWSAHRGEARWYRDRARAPEPGAPEGAFSPERARVN